VPITALGLVLGLRWLPSPPPPARTGGLLTSIDLPGVLLFAGTLTSLLGGLLSLGSRQGWVLLTAVPILGLLLAVRELRCATPFFDIRLLAANPVLIGVFVQFAAVAFIFYSFFFGLPVWPEEVRGFVAKTAGLLIFPVFGSAIAGLASYLRRDNRTRRLRLLQRLLDLVRKAHAAPSLEAIDQFEADLGGNLYRRWNRVSSGSYLPPPVRAHSKVVASGF